MLTVFNCGHSSTVRWEHLTHTRSTVLREKGVDVTSHNKRTDTVVVVVGQRGGSSWIQEQILDMLVPLVVEERCCGAGDVTGAQRWSTSRDSLMQQIDTADS